MIIVIRPNYAVRALIPYPKVEYEKPQYFSFLKKTDTLLSDCYRNRRKTYGFLFLTFCIFSVLGLFYYTSAANGLAPIPIYTPVKTTDVINLVSVFDFRKLHIFASLFLFLTGFTIFGKVASLLFIACDAFLIGFTLQFATGYLQEKSSLGFVILYFLCISLYILIDLLISCEVFKFSAFARGGTKEMFHLKRMAGYITTFILVMVMNMSVSYIFTLICK
jgi:hypothetical protein